MLDLDECRGLSAGDLLIALTGLKHLPSICFDGIPEVSDTLLAEFAQALPLTEARFPSTGRAPSATPYQRTSGLRTCRMLLGDWLWPLTLLRALAG